jgi:hypothetical protein
MSCGAPRMWPMLAGPVKLPPAMSPTAAYSTGSAPWLALWAVRRTKDLVSAPLSQLTAAIEQGGEDFGAQFRAAGTAFTRFAIDNASLMDLMLTARSGGDPSAKAPERPYLIVGALVARGQQAGRLRAGDPDRLRLLIIAAFQGIAMLVTSLGLPAGQVDALVGDAVRLFTD